MAEITGGELNYAVTVDVDQLKKGVTDAEGKLMGFSAIAEKAGEKLDTALKGTATESLKELATEATKTGSTLKSVGDVKIDFGLTKENLAIQKQVIAEIKKNIEEIEKRAKDMAPGMAQASVLGELKKLQEELAAEEKALASLEVEMKKTAVSATTLSSKYLEAKNRLAELTLANKQGTPEYVKAEAEVRKYGTALSDTNARAKALTAGTIGGLAQGLSLITGTMATGTALLGAFGGKSEELNQIMLKTQALLAATVTLQEIKNTTVQKGGVISGIMAFQEMARSRATSLATVNTIRATIAQKALNIVANANPYILLATAILTVVGALALYSAASSESAKRTKLMTDLNKQMADSVAEPIISFKKLQIQWNALGNDLKAKEKFVKDNKERFQELGVSVKNVNDAENLLIKNSVNFQAALMMRARAAAAASIAADKYKEALSAQLQDEQEKRTLKGGSYIEQQNTRLKREARDLVGATLAEISKQGFADADYTTRLNVGYDQSAKDFLKKGNITEFVKKKKEKKPKKGKKPKELSEIFDDESVQEIQQEISLLDGALTRVGKNGEVTFRALDKYGKEYATNQKGTIEQAKNLRINAAERLSEALKRIEIKSLEDRANEQEKFASAYLIIEQNLGKEAADKMYGPLMEGAQSYYGWLTNEQDKLFQKQSSEILTEKDKSNLVFLTQKIDEIQGKKNAFQNFTEGIDEALSKIPTLAGQIEFLQNKAEEQLQTKGNRSFDDGEQKYLQEQADQREKQLKDNYRAFLNEHQNYEEQKKAITDKYNELRSQAKTPEENEKINAAEAAEQLEVFFKQMQDNPEYAKMFTDMNSVATKELQKFRDILIGKLKEAKNEADKIKIGEFIEKIDDLITKRNPGAAIKRMFDVIGNSASTTEQKLQAVQKGLEGFNEYLKIAGEIASGVQDIFVSMGGDMDGVFGDILNSIQDTIEGLEQFSAGASQAIEGFATGNILQGVAGSIKAIGGLIKSVGAWITGDKKKDREIKKQIAVLHDLEVQYNNIAFAAERAIGAQKYDGQRDLIRNLQEQKIAIEQMMRLEQEKKKGDKEKIAGYQQQIQAINQSIEQLKEGIIKDVLQTDIVDAAAKLGDALVENFGRGEDAIKAVENAANDMIKNLLKNQLNLILQNRMKPILDKLLRDAGFNADGTGSFTGLTPEQIADFKAQVAAAGESMNGFLEAYGDIFAGLESPAEGLKGDIKGITERTAGALEGQVNALRIYIAEGLNIQKSNQAIFVSCLQNLVLIEFNTRPLHRIDKNIEEMNGKMKKGLAGFP